METSPLADYGYVVTWVVRGSITLFLALLALITLGPSQYDPYITDIRDKTDEELQTYGKDNSKDGDKNRPTIDDMPEVEKYNSSVTIVVLGDIGRSPRMQYHAISFAEEGAFVNIVGYAESEIHVKLRKSSNVRITALTSPPRFLSTGSRALFPITAPLKVLWQTLNLAYTLYTTQATRWCLVQNPPSIPTLAVTRVISWARNSSLIIDWHNFGWSVLALRLGSKHPLVRVSRLYENLSARTADRHITVTSAMSRYMRREIGVDAVAFHDRPSIDFQPLDATQESRKSVLERLSPTATSVRDITKRKTRLLVTSTSWTADEDFGLLVDALVAYSSSATSKDLPNLLLVITGRGPQKDHYMHLISDLTAQQKLNKVTITTAFLPLSDYAALLSVADLGISLHESTSGLDFPMKVVDMFGAGLPVVGFSGYESWGEVVREGENGRGFQSAGELAVLLRDLLGEKSGQLEELKKGATEESRSRWTEEWLSVLGEGMFYPERRLQNKSK